MAEEKLVQTELFGQGQSKGRTSRRFTDIEKDEIAALYRSGETSTTLSERFRADRSAILYIVRSRGVEVRKPLAGVPEGLGTVEEKS